MHLCVMIHHRLAGDCFTDEHSVSLISLCVLFICVSFFLVFFCSLISDLHVVHNVTPQKTQLSI